MSSLHVNAFKNSTLSNYGLFLADRIYRQFPVYRSVFAFRSPSCYSLIEITPELVLADRNGLAFR